MFLVVALGQDFCPRIGNDKASPRASALRLSRKPGSQRCSLIILKHFSHAYISELPSAMRRCVSESGVRRSARKCHKRRAWPRYNEEFPYLTAGDCAGFLSIRSPQDRALLDKSNASVLGAAVLRCFGNSSSWPFLNCDSNRVTIGPWLNPKCRR